MLSLIVSTIAFFVASFFLKRWADGNDLPKGMTRSLGIFVFAIAISYAVAWIVDQAAMLIGI